MTGRVEIHDVRDPLDGGGYSDIRHLIDGYELHECWNCGHEHFEGPHSARKGICEECMMGQEKVDEEHRDAYGITSEGYQDKGRQFYDDIDREEMRRRFKKTAEENGFTPDRTVVI